MPLGYSLLALALFLTASAGVLFALGVRKPEFGAKARWVAVAATACVISASVYLDYLIATHQFQVAYVAEYSARRSSPQYLFAAFWGGQEGSILLWTMWTSVLGSVLAFKAGGKQSRVWPIFAVLESFLLALVIVKCPFRVSPGPVPADGQGLNPLLENPWMVIHPPILFLGFSSLAMPWIWALYGLIYKDWDGWLARVFPWALFAFGIQGFGVALGGYWAYETLGWGGFWGWDPVEVSSFVPWLFMIALLHGIPIQRANGGYRVSNFLLAALPFGFMCYGTFLTRTGLLSDFSVHSFSSLGRDGFLLLGGWVAAAFSIPLIMLIARFRQIPKPTAYSKVLTREFGYFLASAVLATLGVISAVGMSAPIITKLWIPKGAAAQPGFYNHAMFPLTIVLLLGMAATPYLAWKTADGPAVGRRLLPAYVAAVVLTVGLFLVGAREPWMLLLFAFAVFAGVANLLLLSGKRGPRRSAASLGGILAHIGAAIFLIGVVCLVCFSQKALHVTLVKGQPVQALGYQLTYLGMTSEPYDRKNALQIQVSRGGHSWIATPHLYIAPWEGTDQLFADPPDIRNFFWGDLYLAHYRGPSSLDAGSPNNGITLAPGAVLNYGDYRFVYHGLQWSSAVQRAMASPDRSALGKLSQMRIHALVDVTYRGQTYPIHPELVFDQASQSKYSVPASLPGPPNAILTLEDVQLPFQASLSTTNLPDPLEMVQIDLSTKPMIWLVWLGTVLYTIGGLMAYRRRAAELAREPLNQHDGDHSQDLPTKDLLCEPIREPVSSA